MAGSGWSGLLTSRPSLRDAMDAILPPLNIRQDNGQQD